MLPSGHGKLIAQIFAALRLNDHHDIEAKIAIELECHLSQQIPHRIPPPAARRYFARPAGAVLRRGVFRIESAAICRFSRLWLRGAGRGSTHPGSEIITAGSRGLNANFTVLPLVTGLGRKATGALRSAMILTALMTALGCFFRGRNPAAAASGAPRPTSSRASMWTPMIPLTDAYALTVVCRVYGPQIWAAAAFLGARRPFVHPVRLAVCGFSWSIIIAASAPDLDHRRSTSGGSAPLISFRTSTPWTIQVRPPLAPRGATVFAGARPGFLAIIAASALDPGKATPPYLHLRLHQTGKAFSGHRRN